MAVHADPAAGASILAPDAAAVFAALRQGFGAATRRCPALVREARYEVAGHAVRVRIAGTRLADAVHDPWTHLEAAADTARRPDELRIELWDEREVGLARDPRVDGIDPAERFPFRVSPDQRLVGHRLPQVLSWLDRRAGHVLGCVSDGTRLSVYERGRPLEVPLLFWLRDRGVQLVHAGLVARGEDGVLLLGRSGAGKSTAALACVRAGLEFLGDDKIALLAGADGTYRGESLAGSVHLEPHQLARFPELARWAFRGPAGDEPKALLLLSRVSPARLRSGTTVRALAVVRVVAGELPPLRRAPRRDALVAASLSTMLQLPIDQARTPGILGDLVARVPAYWLDLGPDLDDIPRRVAAIVADAMDPVPRLGG